MDESRETLGSRTFLRVVVVRPASLSRVTNGMVPAVRHGPSLYDEDLCLTRRKVENIANSTVGDVDSVELVRELPREPDFHGRKETSN